MNFNRKLLAALVLSSVGVLASAGAHAQVAAGADGDSDLLLFVWNDADGEGTGAASGPAYVRDLGINWGDINGNLAAWNTIGTTFDKTVSGFGGFAGGSVFSSLFSGGALSTMRWGVFAANDYGGPAGGTTVFSTINGSPAAITGPGVGTSGGQFADLTSIANIPGQQTGNEYTLPTTGTNWIGQQPGTKWGNNAGGAFPGSVISGVGTAATLNFYTIVDTGAVPASLVQFKDGTTLGKWNIASNGDVTYTLGAIPEPSAYALVGLGALALSGFARRRKAA